MTGSVRARTYASVPAVAPNVAAMTWSRTRPRARLRTLPRPMTAAALAMPRLETPAEAATRQVCLSLSDGPSRPLRVRLHLADRDSCAAERYLLHARHSGSADYDTAWAG